MIIMFKINKDNTYYNDVEDAYFYCLDVNDANSYKNLNLKIHSKEKYKYVILNENYDKEKGFFIDFNNPVDLIIYNDEVYYRIKILEPSGMVFKDKPTTVTINLPHRAKSDEFLHDFVLENNYSTVNFSFVSLVIKSLIISV